MAKKPTKAEMVKIDSLMQETKTHYLARDYELAIKALDQVLEIAPNHADTLFIRASAKEKLGRTMEAVADYDRMIELNPANDGAMVIRGIALYKMGKYHEAMADFDRAIEINPADWRTRIYRASVKARIFIQKCFLILFSPIGLIFVIGLTVYTVMTLFF